MPTGLHCLLLGGIDYYGWPGMAGIVTEPRSHDKSRGGRSVKGMPGSVMGHRTKV